MERYKLDAVVIGAGVVGLAVARALAVQGRKVWVLDRCAGFGYGTSSRNSEVIHAGIYYPENSLKAQLCVRGKSLLYDFVQRTNVPFSQCGKLIVATSEAQREKLSSIREKAAANGVHDLTLLDQSRLQALEGELNACAALYSPSTGIVDSHALMQALLHDAEHAGATFVPSTGVRLVTVADNAFELELLGHNTLVDTPILVNAAGLYASHLLRGQGAFPKSCLPKPIYAKGSYFTYSGRVPFKHLIYPVPEDGGLGVHLTLDLGGAARFGPDVEWCGELTQGQLDDFDYRVDPMRRSQFANRVAEYWPAIDVDKLHPGYAGLRPKISFGAEVHNDFCIQGCDKHGLTGLTNLFGIESPGLTSCLAIAEYVAASYSE